MEASVATNNVKNVKNTANTANTAGKVPTARADVDPFNTMMQALKDAGSTRGKAVNAVVSYLSNRTIGFASVDALEAIRDQIKVAKLAKLGRLVGSLALLARSGVTMSTPTFAPADYL